MYTAFYGLSGWPFQQVPSQHHFFPSSAHRHAAAGIGAGIRRGEGVIVLTGAAGTGKTTLIDYLCAELGNERLVAVRLAPEPTDADALLAQVAAAIGIAVAGMDDEQLRRRLFEALGERVRRRQRCLVVIDDADLWPLATLSTLAPITDLRVDGQAALQVLLTGPPDLDDTLARAELEPLRARLVGRERLEPIAPGEVRGYIEHRLGLVGWQGDPRFGAEACAAIAADSGGLPRRINQLCSRLLTLGALEQRHEIDAAAVVAAVAEDPVEPAPEAAVTTSPPAEPDAEPGDAAPAAPLAVPGRDLEQARAEISRLQRKLEQAYDDLSGERRRAEALRAEVDRLRRELHQIELERLRVDAETARRAVEVLAGAQEPDTGALFRRFAGTDT